VDINSFQSEYTHNKGTGTTKEEKTMWTKGSLNINGTDCKFWVKHFEEGSEVYGINEGRISKLEIRVNGKTTCNYDRGWDIEPQDATTKKAYAELLKRFN